jgi:hypothetical protein
MLVMIVKGSTELAKTLKTCLSRGSKPCVRTRQHLSQMSGRRLRSNLGASTYLRDPAADADECSEGRSTNRSEAGTAQGGNQA